MNNPSLGNIQYKIPPKPKSFDEALYKAFLEAPRVLFEQGYAVSGLKLMLSALDTVAFLRSGEGNSGPEFKAWLAKYVDLNSVGINPDELWQHRCALLHMTHFRSRDVHKGKVRFLVPSYGAPPEKYADVVKTRMEAVYGTNYAVYSIPALVKAIYVGLDKFIAEVDSDPDLKSFVISNYGEIVPDTPIGAYRTR